MSAVTMVGIVAIASALLISTLQQENRMHNEQMRYLRMLLLIIIVSCVAVWVITACNRARCKEWKEIPHVTTCYGSSFEMTCEPAKECVRS